MVKRIAGFASGLKRNRKLSERSSRDRRIKAICASAVAASGLITAGTSSALGAGSDTWSGASSTFFSNGGNWSPATNAPPLTGDSLVFSLASPPSGLTLSDDRFTPATFNIAGITFGASAGAYIINPNTAGTNGFTLTSGITNSSAALQTINDLIAMTAVQTFTLTTGGGNITLGGAISGTGGGITTAGSGVLTLGVSNSYTGTTTVGSGTTIKAGNNSALGAAAGALTISGGTLDLGGNTITKGTLTATVASSLVTSTSAGTLVVNYTNTAGQYSGLTVGGAASFIVNGSSGTSTPFGTTLITGTGALGFQNQTGVVRDNNLPGDLGTNGSLLFNGSGQYQNSAAITLASGNAIIVNGSGNLWNYSVNSATGATENGPWSGSGSLTLQQGFNAGLVVAGDMTGFGGTLNVQNAGTTSNNSTTLSFTNTAATVAGSSNATYTQSAVSTGNTGNNIIQWNAAGNRTIALGDLTTTGPAGSFTPGTTVLRDNTASTTATFQVGALGHTSTYAGQITNGNGTIAIDKVGTGIWTLSGTSNNYTGTTTVDNGTLLISGSYTGAGASTVNSGGTLKVNGSLTSSSATVNVNGGGALAGAGGNIAGAVTVAGGASASSQGSVNLSGDGAYTTLTLNGGLTVGGSSASTPSILAFDITSANKSDTLAVGGSNGFVVNAGGAFINPVPTSVTNGETFTLATYSDTSVPAGVTFSNGMLTQTAGFLTETLSVTASAITLGVTTTAFPATAYFTGTYGSNWTDSSGANANFTTDAAGTLNTGQVPGNITDVFLVANTDTLQTIGLGNQNFEIKGLTFTGTGTPGTAPITLNNGTGGGNILQVDADGITLQSGSGGGTIAVSSLILGASETWTNNSTSTLNVTSAVSGASSSLTLSGSGTFILGSANSYGGGTTISGPTVQLGNAAALGSTSAALAISSGALDLNGTSAAVGTLSGAGAITNSSATGAATLTVNSGGTFSGVIQNGSSNTTALTLGGGTLILSGSNTYGGATSLNAGTLQLVATVGNTTAGISSAMSSASTLSLASGTTLQLRGDGNITFATAGISVPATTSTQTFDVGHISSGSANTLTLSGAMAVNDTATATFNVTDSTGSGDTLGLGTLTVQQGTLALNPTTANLSIAGIVGTSTSGNNLITTNGAGNVTFGNFTASAGKSLNLTVGTVGGTTGTVTLSGTDSFNGANNSSTVVLNSGTLILNNTAALGTTLQRFNIGGGSLDAAVANVTSPLATTQIWSGDFTFIGTNSLNLGGGTVTLSGSGRQVTVLANTLTVGAAIGDGGSGFGITKLGPGTLELGGANTYNGVTTISAGKLRIINISGSATGTNTVSLDGANTTLSGTGISTGALTVTNGGRLAPGVNTLDADSSGHTNFGNAAPLSVGTTGGLTLTSANLDFDLGATGSSGGVAASGNDTIATGGALTLTALTVNINELNTGSGASTLDTNTPYILISGATGGVSGTIVTNSFTGITTNFIGNESYTPTYSTVGTDLEVTFSNPVSTPEPGSLALVALSGLGLMRRRRRVPNKA